MKNIRQEYEKASFEAKRHYLSMFFEKLWFDEAGNIVKSDYTPLFQHLIDNQFIRIRANWLPNSRRLRITISSILKAFEDIIQVELLKVRWEEIKRLQITLKTSFAR